MGAVQYRTSQLHEGKFGDFYGKYPGFLVTAQNQALLYNADGTPTARTEKILNATPMNRFGDADELLGATLFLIDESCASFITGVVLPIDGGFSSYAGV